MKCVNKNKILLIIVIVVIVLLGSSIYYSIKLSDKYELSKINRYNENFYNLVNNINSVESLLAKALISKNAKYSAKTLTQIWRDSNLALVYLENIPIKSKNNLRCCKIFKSN